MGPYLLLAAYTALLWLVHYRRFLNRRGFLVAALVPAFALLAFRGTSVGEDTLMYLQMASVARDMGWGDLLHIGSSVVWNMNQYGYGSSVNVGYLLLCKIIITVFGNVEAVQVFCAAVTCGLVGRFIYRNVDNVGMAYWIFLCGGLFMFAFNGMRQMLALAIAAQSYEPLKSKRPCLALGLVVLASALHTSALIFLGIFALYVITDNQKVLKPALVACLLIPLSMPLIESITKLISAQYASYFQNNYWDASVGGIALIWLLIFASLLIVCRKSKTHEERFVALISGVYLSLVLSSMSVSILERVALYPQIFLMLLFPHCREAVDNNNRWWFTMLVVLSNLFLFVSYAVSPTRTYVSLF